MTPAPWARILWIQVPIPHYEQLVLGCGLLVLGACDTLPEDALSLHRQASASEHQAVAALDAISSETSRRELSELRETFETSANEARELREHLRDLLNDEKEGRLGGTEKLERASELNDDLLRCHETLRERAGKAFQFVATGRARRSSLKRVWGLVDPRRCFDELAPAWDALAGS